MPERVFTNYQAKRVNRLSSWRPAASQTPGPRCFNTSVMVHHQPACLLNPGMSSLNEPPFRQHCKAIGIRAAREDPPGPAADIGWMAYDLDLNIMLLMDRLGTTSYITSINEDRGYTGILFHTIGHDRVSTVTVLHASSRHTHGKYQSQSIDQYMTLTAFDLLCGILAARSTLR